MGRPQVRRRRNENGQGMRSIATDPRRAEPQPEELLRRARELGPRLAAVGDEIERRRELPEEIVSALAEAGLFHVLLPRSLGGAELRPAEYVAIVEEIAKHDASAAWCVGQATGCTISAAYLAPEIAREIFAPPRGIVAWGPPSGAQARVAEGGFRLSGSWSFASGIHHANWLGAHVAIFDADGSPRLRPDGSPVIRTLLFRKEKARLTDIWHVIGLRGTGSDTYTVEDLFVPESFTILRDGETPPREPGTLYRFNSSNVYSAAFAGVALGIARRTLDAFIELARDKTPRGQKRTLRDNNVIQSQVAQCEARLSAARVYLMNTLAAVWDAVEERGRLGLEDNASIRLAATWAIHQARDAVTMIYHAAGATAIFESNPFERRFRDVHTVAQQYQGRQAHFESVGQVLLGLPPESTMFTF